MATRFKVLVKVRVKVRVGVLAFFTTFFVLSPAFLVAMVFGFLVPAPVAVFLVGVCAPVALVRACVRA